LAGVLQTQVKGESGAPKSVAMALATAVLLVVGPATVASAESPPLITSLKCDSMNNWINCSMTFQADGPATIDWFGVFSLDMFRDFNFRNKTSISFSCLGLSPLPDRVRVTVTDSQNNTARNEVGVTCRGFPPLQLTYFDCDSGASQYICVANFAGGTPPVSIRWVISNAFRPEFNDQTVIRVGCRPGTALSIGVVITDAIGNTTGDTSICPCSRVQQ
jgi:hypothetical protein